jgi:hypothetical protein
LVREGTIAKPRALRKSVEYRVGWSVCCYVKVWRMSVPVNGEICYAESIEVRVETGSNHSRVNITVCQSHDTVEVAQSGTDVVV